MRIITKDQMKVIFDKSAEGFEVAFNNAMNKIISKGGKVKDTVFNNSQGYCAYIVYTERVEIAETVEEQYEQVGDCHCCGECKYLNLPNDKRIKRVHCGFNKDLLRSAETPCCEEFYEAMAIGSTLFLKEKGE